jgi:hypothetical protein
VNAAEGGEITTCATTCATAIVAWPTTLPTCAEITALPLATAVTNPVALSTVATAAFDERQTTVAETGDPAASTVCAVNDTVRPRVPTVSVPGVTWMAATAGMGEVESFEQDPSAKRATANTGRRWRRMTGAPDGGFMLYP